VMRIMCSHAGNVQAETAAALARYAPQAEYVDTSADPMSYARAIAERWNQGGALMIVEHDNEITADVIPSFEACPEPWCTYQYEIFAPPWTRMCDTGLGCTRFSAAFQRDFNFGELVVDKPCSNCGKPHAIWGSLDFTITVQIGAHMKGVQHHVHGTVRHFHPYQAINPLMLEGGQAAPIIVKGGFRRREGTPTGLTG
jgi:hypothetical protein